jgi:hypothetical protein
MTKLVYGKCQNRGHVMKILEIQIAAILSLCAKMESNKVNYPEVISAVCGFDKNDII